MKSGDLVTFNESMQLYYMSLKREDLAVKAKDLSMLVLDTVCFTKGDPDSKLVTCLSYSENDPYTAMFHSEDLIVLQSDIEKHYK